MANSSQEAYNDKIFFIVKVAGLIKVTSTSIVIYKQQQSYIFTKN